MKRSKAVRRKAKSLTESGQLLPWELLFAEFMATQIRRPAVDVQVATATELARDIGVLERDEYIQYTAIKLLKQRKAYKEYLSAMDVGGLKAARRMLQIRYPRFADNFIWATERMRLQDNPVQLARAMLPMVERIDPRKFEIGNEAISIDITVHQAEGLTPNNDDAIEVDYEVINEDPKALLAG